MTLIQQIEEAVLKASVIMIEAKNRDHELIAKEGLGNFVTVYDERVEDTLQKALAEILPDASFLGEEEDKPGEVLKQGYTFIVDPIDGTLNFAKDLDASMISVALLKDGKQEIGVCYDPYRREMFTAEKGKGAYLNGKKIHVSSRKLSEGIFFSGSAPYYPEKREKTIENHAKLFRIANDYRRFGSAVFEICAVACGRGEVYLEEYLQPWDHAAATLILKEADGTATTIDGEEIPYDRPCSVLAHNGIEDILSYLK